MPWIGFLGAIVIIVVWQIFCTHHSLGSLEDF